MANTTSTQRFQRIVIAATGLAVAVLLFRLALPRLIEGFATEKTLSLVTRTVLEDNGSPAEYGKAASELENTLSGDGDGLIREAEMVALGGGNGDAALEKARSLVVQGLGWAPLNPRGWTLLCEIDSREAALANHCMETGFFVAPFDWFTARRRALLAAHLWPSLPPDLQGAAAQRAKLMWDTDMWTDHRSRNAILDIYLAPNGPALLQAAFQNDKPEMRTLNKWLIDRQTYSRQQH